MTQAIELINKLLKHEFKIKNIIYNNENTLELRETYEYECNSKFSLNMSRPNTFLITYVNSELTEIVLITEKIGNINSITFNIKEKYTNDMICDYMTFIKKSLCDPKDITIDDIMDNY